MNAAEPLPVPPHFDPERVGEVWRVDYEAKAREAGAWRTRHEIGPSAADAFRVGLLLVDVQNTFCIPGFELFVGGRSGTGAVDDNRRLCRFLYRNLASITTVLPTMDTHRAIQIFHALMLVDEQGNPPTPYTLIEAADVEAGRWRFNEAAIGSLEAPPDGVHHYLRHYTTSLADKNRYALTVWPYHAMLGGIGHALVSAVEEAVFFHTVARLSQVELQLKGDDPWTEHYSALGPEVGGNQAGARNVRLLATLAGFDAVIVAGQSKSHCVSWTVADLLSHLLAVDPAAVARIYLLEDCTSPVVVPGAIDYTDDADRAFEEFQEAGMHRVLSTVPMGEWPGPISSAAGSST